MQIRLYRHSSLSNHAVKKLLVSVILRFELFSDVVGPASIGNLLQCGKLVNGSLVLVRLVWSQKERHNNRGNNHHNLVQDLNYFQVFVHVGLNQLQPAVPPLPHGHYASLPILCYVLATRHSDDATPSDFSGQHLPVILETTRNSVDNGYHPVPLRQKG